MMSCACEGMTFTIFPMLQWQHGWRKGNQISLALAKVVLATLVLVKKLPSSAVLTLLITN